VAVSHRDKSGYGVGSGLDRPRQFFLADSRALQSGAQLSNLDANLIVDNLLILHSGPVPNGLSGQARKVQTRSKPHAS